MKELYQMIGTSQQSHYKRVTTQSRSKARAQVVIADAMALRSVHRHMGCRKLYHELKPVGLGRDKTEALLLSHGFRLTRKRSYHRTTYRGDRSYPNLISGLEVCAINQLWVSDITYIPLGAGKPLYLTLIMDVYSRKIKGWSLSATLLARDTVLMAYKKALACLNDGESTDQLIFHSDKGSQYICRDLLALHSQYNVRPSMGGKAWENAHAESLNGILKREYISFSDTKISLKEGRMMMKQIIHRYNTSRPHGSLKNMKPVEYETFVEHLEPEQKPRYRINY